jgi:hypothetical protein
MKRHDIQDRLLCKTGFNARLAFMALGLTAIASRAYPIRRPVPFVVALALAGGYATLLAWFGRVDFYHNDFFVSGTAVAGYEIARLIFIPYFAWTVYCAGALANDVVFGRAATADFPAWQRCPLFFITGAGLWHLVMFIIGLAGFDIKSVALVLSLATMVLGIPQLAECLHEAGDKISRLRLRFTVKSSLTALLWLAIVAVSVVFVLVKGLYPAGGSDYYNHYFQFYQRVIETGSIRPNDVWYQFYYTSGYGLYFLAMLLTDALAPQLVATGFIGCGAMIVYALLRTATRSSVLPLIGILLYVGVYIYTPGAMVATALSYASSSTMNIVSADWGILEKGHELTAVLLLGMIWIADRAFRNDTSMPGPWLLALHAAVIGIALLTLPLALLAGLYLAGYVVWFAATRQWRIALRPFAAGVTAALCLLVIGAINYIYTGFPSDMLEIRFWPYADLDKVMRWGTLLEVLTLQKFQTQLAASSLPLSWTLVPVVAKFLRLELWWPLFVAAAPFVAFHLRNKAARTASRARLDGAAWSALIWFSAVVILIALFAGGRTQPISFYRVSSFCYAPTLCLALLLCHLALPPRHGAKADARPVILVVCGLLAIAIGAIAVVAGDKLRITCQNLTAILGNAVSLQSGRFSLQEAYQHQEGKLEMPFGAIYPGIAEPWRLAGPGTRIWSFNQHAYCMLPDCNVQKYLSVRFSPSWQTVYFGSPDQAVSALRAEGLNYFFFSAELPMRDPLPLTPLFAPAAIGKYLAIRWTDGTSYLLTWPGPDTTPIDQKFLSAYANAKNSPLIEYESWRDISSYIDRHREHLRPFFVPWCRNCAGMEPLPVNPQ